MPSPSDERRLCIMFDAFCRKVSKNYVLDLLRKSNNYKKHFSEEPVDLLLEFIGEADRYPSDDLVLYADGQPCSVNDEVLYDALKSLPEKQRTVILWDFWYDITDEEIARRLEVTARTVYNLRQRAFSSVRKFYEERGRDP